MSEVARRKQEKGFGGPETIHDAWRTLAGGSVVAANTLVKISRSGRSEAARVAASKTILEMVGFGGREAIAVNIVPPQFDPTAGQADGRIPASQVVRDRMALLATPAYDPEPDEDVVDAVLVESDTEYD